MFSVARLWGGKEVNLCGTTQILNNSCRAYNAKYIITPESTSVKVKTLKSINQGEEITVSYNDGRKWTVCHCCRGRKGDEEDAMVAEGNEEVREALMETDHEEQVVAETEAAVEVLEVVVEEDMVVDHEEIV